MNASPNTRHAVPAAAAAGAPSRGRPQTLKLESLGLLVRRVRDGIIEQVESALRADGMDITHMQFRALTWIGKSGGCNASELARVLEHDAGALTRVIDRLVEKGFVLRESQAGDRRVFKLRLTESGDALWQQAWAHFERVNALAVRGLSAVERRQLMELLGRVAQSLETPS